MAGSLRDTMRDLYLSVGRRAQHLVIAAEAAGLGCFVTEAALLDLDLTTHAPVHTVTIGHKGDEAGVIRPGA